MHQASQGTAVGVAAAIRCYREAAQRGSQLARMSLAALYREGIGVPQDHDEAERIYKEGAGAGEASSISSWALMLNRTGRPDYQPLMLALRIRAAEIDPARHAGLLEILRENMPRATIDDAKQLAKEQDIVAAVEKRLRAA
jgi:TPR repeat protein